MDGDRKKDSKLVKSLVSYFDGGSPSKGTVDGAKKDCTAIHGACGGQSTSLLPKEEEEMAMASTFAADQEKMLQKMTRNFATMGTMRLLWDSKVPQKVKKWYHFVSLTPSNRLEVISEIQKYLDFYQEMETAVRKIRGDDEKTEAENENPHVIVVALKKKLKDMLDAANLGENLTSSSAIYDLHKEFMEGHVQLEDIIKNVEIVSLKQGMETMTKRWQESMLAMERLTARLATFEENAQDMSIRMEAVLTKNEQLTEQNEKVLESNQQLSAENALLLEWVKLQLDREKQRNRRDGVDGGD